MLIEHLYVDTVLFIELKFIKKKTKTQLKVVVVTKGIYWLRYGWIQGLCNIISIDCLHPLARLSCSITSVTYLVLIIYYQVLLVIFSCKHLIPIPGAVLSRIVTTHHM